MPSHDIKYLDYESFSQLLFSIVEEEFSYDPTDPLPDYRREDSASLEKILSLIQNDQYYADLFAKAAYLFVSIVEGHIYSNGNKRLGMVAMLYFLFSNSYKGKFVTGELYELCLYVADKERNNDASFQTLKAYTEEFLKNHQ